MKIKKQNNIGKVYRGKTKYIDKDTKPERNYVVFKDNGKNVSIAKLKSNVNMIVYNQNEKSPYKKPSKENVLKFKYILEASGKKVTVRLERGADIDAACGQLASKAKQKWWFYL